jgi:hypothetical protein
MGIYVYITYIKWLRAAKEKGYEYFTDAWLPRHRKLCEEYGVELLKWGLPFGVVEDHVYIYETDLSPAGFQKFKGAVSAISQERLIDYTRSTIVNCNV